VVFIAVPTRHDGDGEGSMPTIRAAAENVGNHLAPETTVVVESTVPPGEVAEVFTPTDGETTEFAVAHSPVRLSSSGSAADRRARTKLIAAERPASTLTPRSRSLGTVVDCSFDRIVCEIYIFSLVKLIKNYWRSVRVVYRAE
jgi:UDP-N-acetyl-D-galactosamine dehydrogenase